ncbi:stage II sporulation protein R [Priestia endophytica]|jgi:stage II sporulation protein R|uniref:Stage II sporulation protein R n=1 Tax=Priestia endophytica TaxID=135735 RepID=A0AAX1Q7L2_9BACI|nr:stage II sporulation protein R [Priestia endophytica]MBG9810774.1 stage II sporulation protein R [Priestia endophytica]MCM3540326.1 stage II sporulation protein R [Priestia endophytica]RAS73051.1 stage II sporulation protein R [Priestia endophytica]RAS77498.1 stage II sporulation protein R [Priestia endophytica]RAS87400.1 stage II sporulation protein R [Priestia endophytica]
MKKQAIIFLLLLFVGAYLQVAGNGTAQATERTVIPNDAIRLRILANSDSDKDQKVKRMVRDEVNKEINKWVEELTSFEEASKVIQSNLPEIKEIANRVLKEQGFSYEANVKFGKVSFPTKLYGNLLYPAGEYEAVLITLGEGEGANWWCVLFPPMCFLDFSNGQAIPEQEGVKASESTSKPVKEEVTQTEPSVNVEEEETKNTKPKKKESKIEEKEQKPEVKFFVVEWFEKVVS